MDGKQLNKLIRVLAQTGSDNDHVALEALRAAQRAVADDGSHWTEFTRSLVDGEFRILATNITVLRRQIERLKTQLRQARAGLPPVPRSDAEQRLSAENQRLRAELKVRAGLRPPPLPKTAVRGRPASAAAQPSSSVTSAAVPRFIVMPYRASIAAMMRQVFSDPELARLGDRELARRYGLSPTTIGNWRRRLRK